ncbi:DUF7694 domain-containing protein [Paraburkholderia adhaesiva]|uniref:DUF7694 domain-containing protein n=1 Tax=Paraburkholderia adhaesiva TaxID=2883244 RepID=UPI001F3664B2|nr:hypothetical protein [Paraburkholderia adhaesiva]
MRDLAHLEAGRFRHLGGDAHNGAFHLHAPTGVVLHVIVSDGDSWDHVSITVAGEARCPTWEEMAWVKEQCFEADETVMQLHPARAQYVNNHPWCLHLWRPQRRTIPLPPPLLVGLMGVPPARLARMTPEEIAKLRALALTGWKWSGS